jgi:anti-anti-sigma factor
VIVVLDGDGALITPEGDLDRSTAARFNDELDHVLATGRSPLTVDLSGITFADVSGYRAMVEFGRRCTEGGLVNQWVRPSGTVRVLWQILGPPGGTTTDRDGVSFAATPAS